MAVTPASLCIKAATLASQCNFELSAVHEELHSAQISPGTQPRDRKSVIGLFQDPFKGKKKFEVLIY